MGNSSVKLMKHKQSNEVSSFNYRWAVLKISPKIIWIENDMEPPSIMVFRCTQTFFRHIYVGIFPP